MNLETPHVVFLANTLTLGGSERMLVSLAQRLPALGYRTSVATMCEPGVIGEELINSPVPFFPNLAPHNHSFGNRGRLEQFLAIQETDLLYILDHENAIFWGRLAARRLKIPTVVALHSTRLWGGKPSLRWITRKMSQRDAAIVAVAEGQKRYLVEELGLSPNKIQVIHNGIDLGKFENPLPYHRNELGLPEGKYIGAMCALRPEKNLPLLVQAFHGLTANFPLWHLAIVGEGPEEEKLHVLISELDLGDRVHLLGFRRNMERIYPLMELIVLASLPVVETLPLTLIEAGAAGLPVIATNVGSVDEIVADGETGLLVPSGEVIALREALRTVMLDERLRKEMGENGRQRVNKMFSLESCLASHDILFDNILSTIAHKQRKHTESQ